MPELPEVEVTRRGLLDHLPGRIVVGIAVSGHRLRTPMPRRLLHEHILERRILTIDRRAKYLLVRLDNGAVLVIHLGMTGKLGLLDGSTPRHRHDHLILTLDNGKQVRLNDSRRFGAVMVWPADAAENAESAFSAREGIEPLGREFTAAHLHRLADRKTTPVKSLLMNGRLIAGIGNIYANEILFASRIHPETPAGRLTAADWKRIAAESQRILQLAIATGGSTIADFLNATGHPGYFQLHFQVYGREHLSCPRCGQAIVKTALAGRATYFCLACQPPP
ncbi:MAG: bifunctional DNA-formamidopyrimidine glycosylase/DNA-(apurinic or apyrimidinic site) lyase [Desulfobulbus sp.]|jgi:formamidopyrimidine-DNA glycosylase|uniref:bifunctional DNA-formamidopyrimidine glycosylase/DNA-(apurinic or apyrimidinic site) lyase n=1 Tax=Desulfobulbus sp. TaxID=895 RepID=UPI0028460328|nr:bifunctional DNA-formamidopyrimidine glycosylase/DNA-(apurinic or apyrimidinic site) lyase [Desulfobulbus sp.]MDR2549402.1 bifunctional DNA-formamidopyrimidine glycosylase/DNA-(apurinic or apyrimidinic site) lyase [Desulfobulbus sp.]